MMQQCRCGRLSVCAGNADQHGAVVVLGEQFYIADHRPVGLFRADDDRMGRRMGQRDAGAQHQRREVRPVRACKIGEGNILVRRFRSGFGIVVPGRDSRSTRHQRMRGRTAGAAESEDREVL